jgi:hypothetical protein
MAGPVPLFVLVAERELEMTRNMTKTAGRYEVNFDASNLASGIYFYRLQAGNATLTRKMLLAK